MAVRALSVHAGIVRHLWWHLLGHVLRHVLRHLRWLLRLRLRLWLRSAHQASFQFGQGHDTGRSHTRRQAWHGRSQRRIGRWRRYTRSAIHHGTGIAAGGSTRHTTDGFRSRDKARIGGRQGGWLDKFVGTGSVVAQDFVGLLCEFSKVVVIVALALQTRSVILTISQTVARMLLQMGFALHTRSFNVESSRISSARRASS
jgi:hypothetical protein